MKSNQRDEPIQMVQDVTSLAADCQLNYNLISWPSLSLEHATRPIHTHTHTPNNSSLIKVIQDWSAMSMSDSGSATAIGLDGSAPHKVSYLTASATWI